MLSHPSQRLSFLIVLSLGACSHSKTSLSVEDQGRDAAQRDVAPTTEARPSDTASPVGFDAHEATETKLVIDLTRWFMVENSSYPTTRAGGGVYIVPDSTDSSDRSFTEFERIRCPNGTPADAANTERLLQGRVANLEPWLGKATAVLKRFRIDYVRTNPTTMFPVTLPTWACYALRYDDGSWGPIHTGIPVVSQGSDRAFLEIEPTDGRRIQGVAVLTDARGTFIERMTLWILP